MKKDITFSFGKNWKNFLNLMTDDRTREAEQSLTDFLKTNDLQGKNFLDIGCGSGLFSFSAYRLGANHVVSFDVDPFSVECCRYMHQKADSPENWQILEGSILDSEFTDSLGKFDIVYSWGVLHHTGKMWESIKNAATLVHQEGFLYIALYNETKGLNGSLLWLKIKKIYNILPKPGKWILEILYSAMFCLNKLVKLKNPISDIRNYQSKRGMDFMTDVRDWLGGYPYEFTTTDKVSDFMKLHFPRFTLINLKSTSGTGVNWFLFSNH